MDALQMLRDDHRKVKELFRRFEDTSDNSTKQAIVETALAELYVHTRLEEEIFYPSVRRQGDTDAMVDKSEEEHHAAEMLMDELAEMRPSDRAYDAKFRVLAESVRMHIEEEESVMLPLAAEVGIERLRDIGQRMDRRKREILGERGRRRAEARAGGRGNGRRTARAGSRSRRRTNGGLESMTREELYEKAKQQDVQGRSGMKKRELIRALKR